MAFPSTNITKEICVVHLVRQNNDIELFRNFLNSYRENQGGIDHDLLILFKGFDSSEAKIEYTSLLNSVPHLTYDVSDDGFDITAYMSVTRQYAQQYRYFCFLNSHSIILDSEWLSKLHKHIVRADVGLVGATCSWQSHRGAVSFWKLLAAATLYCTLSLFERKRFRVKLQELIEVYHYLIYLMKFDSFPNIHIRTTAFMISSRLMLENCHHRIKTKFDAYEFESGKKGLSKSTRNNNMKILMVGRDSRGYDELEWNKCNIYLCSEQENLLVADNMTRQYQHGSRKIRKHLASMAWDHDYYPTTHQHWSNIANRKQYEEKVHQQKIKLKALDSGSYEDSVNIIIFGSNVLGTYFYDWIRDNTSNIVVIGFVDSHITTSAYTGSAIHTPQYLVDHPSRYDYILISSNRFYDEIIEQLEGMNIDTSEVI